MADRGVTYTIVVDRNKEIVSATCNGKPMGKEGDQDIPVPGREGQNEHNIPVPPDMPHGFSGCICLGELHKVGGGQCFWRWGKLF